MKELLLKEKCDKIIAESMGIPNILSRPLGFKINTNQGYTINYNRTQTYDSKEKKYSDKSDCYEIKIVDSNNNVCVYIICALLVRKLLSC